MTSGNGSHGDAIERNVGWENRRLDLSTRTAVVTGGGRGIGRATAVALALEGIRAVAVVDLLDEVAEFARETNERLGREAIIPFQGDVTRSDFRRSVFEAMEARFDAVHICVPAAGITRDYLSVKIDAESGEKQIYAESDFRRVIEIDLTAPIYWALETIASVAADRRKRSLKKWQPDERVQGAVIFIGSVSSAGNRGQISYATAKAGLEGAAATLATEAIFHGVRAAIIHPGYTDTAMVRALGEAFVREHILPQTQLNRLILPEEVADAIVFLIRNSAISGSLWADAGWHPRA